MIMRVPKFKDAYNQGCEQARFFLEKIAALYRHSLNYLHKFSLICLFVKFAYIYFQVLVKLP